MIRRLALVLGLLTALSITVGVASMLPITGTAPLQVVETDDLPPVPTAAPEPDDRDEAPAIETAPADHPPEPDPEASPMAWVCVALLDDHGAATLKPGRNPIEVPAGSNNAQDADDPDHPSYVSGGSDEVCDLP